MTVQELTRILMALPLDSEVRVYDKRTKSSPLVVDAREVGWNKVYIDIERFEEDYTEEDDD